MMTGKKMCSTASGRLNEAEHTPAPQKGATTEPSPTRNGFLSKLKKQVPVTLTAAPDTPRLGLSRGLGRQLAGFPEARVFWYRRPWSSICSELALVMIVSAVSASRANALTDP
jgi:hypothetical protein